MKIIESDFANQIIKFVENQLGNIFFFNHVAVVELKEGIHFDLSNAAMIIDELNSYFGSSQPYGVVATDRASHYLRRSHWFFRDCQPAAHRQGSVLRNFAPADRVSVQQILLHGFAEHALRDL